MKTANLVAGLFIFVEGCSAATRPKQGIVEPTPGQVLESISGPMPNFGTYATVEDAIFAACPIIMGQPHASVPVPTTDQNFKMYWRMSREYCAWLYAPEGKRVEMSFLTVSAVQDEPEKRKCKLPAYVDDPRYPSDSIAYLVILHNHPFEDGLSAKDLWFLVQMAQLHGFAPSLDGRQMSISIVAFFGKESDGRTLCGGFYQYLPARNSELIKVTSGDGGRWKETLIGHVRWSGDEDYVIER